MQVTSEKGSSEVIPVSSLGIGTYLGSMDEPTDALVVQAVKDSIQGGINVVDTAINYRGQRAEKSIGEALRRLFLAGEARREELFISSKAGFVPYEGHPVADVKDLFHDRYVSSGLATPSDLIAGCHCLAPSYLLNQLDLSRKNLGLETLDLYYLHNPEMQLQEIPWRVLQGRLKEAFMALESAVVQGKIRSYGIATWDGLREDPSSALHLPLEEVLGLAQKAAQDQGAPVCHFTSIQLPLNFAYLDGYFGASQKVQGRLCSVVSAAKTLGLNVFLSAPLLHGQLLEEIPFELSSHWDPSLAPAQNMLAFLSALQGVDSALVGLKAKDHVSQVTGLLQKQSWGVSQIQRMLDGIQALYRRRRR